MIDTLYTKKAQQKIKDMLTFAESKGRIEVYEYRNFIDLDLIPLIKVLTTASKEAR